ncbi:FMN-binding negative transcriptional regulator [Cognaticolwellia mytili]|uniref:FMN-binding negative transcriptional regulator n=1 Tax=Cognaticolwellia mytili TaxID=1888913 RepID=UPI000A173FEF|nr:FMN-binding negative transcriptional regulator [Cognaticolwellia mytili]
MYIPNKFKQSDAAALKTLMVDYPFATLIGTSELGLEVNHIPLMFKQVDGKDKLQGHIAKANPLWKSIADKAEVLVVFNGPNCYISPNFYPTKMATGKAVPTWNYVAVHVKGHISFVHDNTWNLNLLDRLTTHHEALQPKPWSIEDAPKQYIAKMLPAVVGIDIDITSITGKWKVSQNQPTINKQGIFNALSGENESHALKIAEFLKSYMEETT